ncbi:NnrU family protein [Novosphingobium colocasiae]|uniref:NnrU protein n=1 Tax=Novosphingobium colocasiae TaxID=1256513 RepID=A0A918PET8_9SPHN|nr:NnrU family protein [Novosphingobium colocasiae]GGZ03461.1 NnrU protein [Novosphingobium colocasiae]
MSPIASLILANAAFVGSHFLLSHPLRAGLVSRLGEKAFLGVYSLVSFATFGWIVVAFRAAPMLPLGGGSDVAWALASLLTLVALVLLVGSFKGNPALPDTPIDRIAAARADGVFAITRHPMMWSFALWALAHVLVWPSARTLATAGAMAFLALVGAHLQDRKKERLLGASWRNWEAQTSYWPRLAGFAAVGVSTWLIAVAAWLGLTWVHLWLAGIPAGLWRWL